MKSSEQHSRVEAAETIALQAFAYIAANDQHLSRFLALTGTVPDRLTTELMSKSFLLGVLDHLLSDESLLLAFCANAGLDPSRILPARQALAGERLPDIF